MLIRKVEEVGQVSDAPWSQVFELVDGEAICTWGGGVLAQANSIVDLGG